MIEVTIYTKNDRIVGFKSEGHAGYDESGKDIICAAVSTLVINTINSIELFTGVKYDVIEDAEAGLIDFRLSTNKPSKRARVLLDAFELGINSVMQGNTEYLLIRSEEV